MTNDELVEHKRRVELLRVARQMLTENYLKTHNDNYTNWVSQAQLHWQKTRTQLPYVGHAALPTEADIVAKAVELYNDMNPAPQPAPTIIPVPAPADATSPPVILPTQSATAPADSSATTDMTAITPPTNMLAQPMVTLVSSIILPTAMEQIAAIFETSKFNAAPLDPAAVSVESLKPVAVPVVAEPVDVIQPIAEAVGPITAAAAVEVPIEKTEIAVSNEVSDADPKKRTFAGLFTKWGGNGDY